MAQLAKERDDREEEKAQVMRDVKEHQELDKKQREDRWKVKIRHKN